MQAIPTGQTLGATIHGADLSLPLSVVDRDRMIGWAGQYGVLSFPDQRLTPRQLRDFSAHFGALEVNVATLGQQAELPEVMTLSNIVENGKPVGLSDAGQSWHTDMSYSSMIAFCNILYGIEIPMRDGQPLGNTEFCNMHAAYAGLRAQIGVPTRLRDLGVRREQLAAVARHALGERGLYFNPRPVLTAAPLQELLEQAW